MSNQQVIFSVGMTLERLEELAIIKAYNFYGNNKTATANSLGISIRTLDNKLEKYQLSATQEKDSSHERDLKRHSELARARGISNVIQTDSRIRVESVADFGTQHQMPLQERAEIQEVLPRQVAGGGNKRGR